MLYEYIVAINQDMNTSVDNKICTSNKQEPVKKKEKWDATKLYNNIPLETKFIE